LNLSQSNHVLATVVLIGLLVVVNVIGIQESSAINLVLAFADLITQFVLVILGIILLLNFQHIISSIHLVVAPTWSNFLAGISRLSYSMAGVDLLPHRLARLHPRFKTPYISIIVFGILAALLVLPGIIAGSKEIDLMSAVYSLAATFAFCSAHLSVMRLRFIEPALHRPYRMPWNVKFGRDSIPVLSLVGALFIGTVFTQLLFENISNTTFIFM